MKGRTYEQVRCPGCHRLISGYVPHATDGADLRLVAHHASLKVPCPASDRRVVWTDGRWTVAP